MPKFLEKVPVRLSGGVSQQSISEGSDGNTQLADHVFPSGPEVFTGMGQAGIEGAVDSAAESSSEAHRNPGDQEDCLQFAGR
jgi:hypothetical protein